MKAIHTTAVERRSHMLIGRSIAMACVIGVVIAGCGGGGGGDSSTSPPMSTPTATPAPTPTPTPTSGTSITITGKITFDQVPFFPGFNTGLNFAGATHAPARSVVIEALDAANTSGTPLASGVTNATGNYALTVPISTNVILRAKAQMLASGTGASWNFEVLNNANGDALYVLDSAAFNTGSADIANKDMNAQSGWDGVTYTDTRAAAPFAILDAIYGAVQTIVSARAQAPAFPALNIFWSTSNRAVTPFCPMTGAINTTAFHTGDSLKANCVSQTETTGGIYVLGDFAGGNGDTDEFDAHVIAHEFGHYVEHTFSRADSQGGNHSTNNKLDLRVAMSEGWGNAFSAMALNDPLYRDSQFQNGASVGFSFNVSTRDPAGWYSEGTVEYMLWSLFSSPMNLGFAPILQALEGKQKATPAFTSVFSFLDAIEAVAPSSAAAITSLANNNGINSVDPFGVGESNSGSDPTVLPVYNGVSGPTIVCSTLPTGQGGYNKLGNRKFFKIVASTPGVVSVSLAANATGGVAATDPDFLLWSAGALKIDGTKGTGSTENASATLPAGTYVLEVYDFAYNDPTQSTPTNNGPHCMTVSITTP